jgi:KEOPS complex subunit Pcc1
VLTFSFNDPTTADAIARALAPEASQTEVPKTRGDVRADGATLQVTLHAEDLPSLRATVNSHLRWVDAATKAARLGRG